MINIKKLIISILIPNAIGFLGSLLGNSNNYENVIKPDFVPPSYIFPIVWVILFTLMGISSYIIFNSKTKEKTGALIIYVIQLILNSLWSLFFFRLQWHLFALIWLLIILMFVIIMTYKFYKINKAAGLIQIPYILWLIFAAIINLAVYILNA